MYVVKIVHVPFDFVMDMYGVCTYIKKNFFQLLAYH